jgi:RWD domain
MFRYKGVLALKVKYTPNYPDELPEFEVESIEGELTQDQRERIMSTLTASVSLVITRR